jgi:hypothetical protein
VRGGKGGSNDTSIFERGKFVTSSESELEELEEYEDVELAKTAEGAAGSLNSAGGFWRTDGLRSAALFGKGTGAGLGRDTGGLTLPTGAGLRRDI